MNPILGMLVGGGIQAGLGTFNNLWSQIQQAEARQENYKLGEMAATAADKRTRALYNDFYSPEALMRQYKAAGLSPSMMFGGTPGQGGMSGAQGTGAAGLGTLYQPISMIEGAQVAKLNAETENIKADTANKTGEGPLGAAQIDNIIADTALKTAETGNQQAAAALTAVQTEISKIEQKFKEETFWTDVANVNEMNNKLQEEVKIAAAQARSMSKQADFDEDMYDTKCAELTKQVKLLAQQILTEQGVQKLNDAQKRSLEKMIEKTTYDMQLDYWHSLLEQKEFNFQINQARWERAFRRWAKQADMHMQAQGLQVQQWSTKWNTLGHIVSGGVTAVAIGAMKPKGK